MPANKKILAIAVIVIIFFIALFGALFFLQMPKNTAPAIIPSPEPRRVQSYNGEVLSVQTTEFTMQALASNNPLDQDALLHISFTKDTRFTKMTIPKSSPENAERIETISKDIAFSDMRVGDRAIVYVEKNIRGKSEFVADSVTIMEFR